jgi:hypothetical protein
MTLSDARSIYVNRHDIVCLFFMGGRGWASIPFKSKRATWWTHSNHPVLLFVCIFFVSLPDEFFFKGTPLVVCASKWSLKIYRFLNYLRTGILVNAIWQIWILQQDLVSEYRNQDCDFALLNSSALNSERHDSTLQTYIQVPCMTTNCAKTI